MEAAEESDVDTVVVDGRPMGGTPKLGVAVPAQALVRQIAEQVRHLAVGDDLGEN